MHLGSGLTLLLAAACAAAAGETTPLRSVQLKQAPVRAAASPFSAITGTLAYGDRVLLLEQTGSWCRVRQAIDGDAAGWIHAAALTEHHLSLKPGSDTRVAATSDEVAIAGKGFTAQVESQVQASNAKLDFATIDRMEQIVIPMAELKAFVKTGRLTPGGAP